MGGLFISAAMSSASAEDLYDVYQHALASDPQLKAAEASFLSSMEQKPQALAQLKPQVSLSGGANYNLSYSRQTEDFTDTLTANYNLNAKKALIHPDYDEQVNIADASIGQSRANLALEQQKLIIRVAEAYFQFLIAQDNLEYARAEKQSAERQLVQIKRYMQVGKSTITDVSETQAQRDSVVAREILSMQQLDIARESLKALTGKYYTKLASAPLTTPLGRPSPASANEWVDLAFTQSKQLEVYKFAILVADSTLAKAKTSGKPTLDLVAQHSGNISRLDLEQEKLDASVGVQFNWPLSTGGSIDSSVRQAMHSLHQSQHQLEVQRRAVEQNVKTSYLSVLGEIAQATAYAQSLRSAELAVRAARAGFEAGTRTSIEVLLRVKDTFAAKNNLVKARYNYMLNLLKLRQAAGILAPEDLTTLRVHLKK